MDAHRFSQISGMDLWDGKARPPAPVENLCPIPGCSRPLRTFRFTRISLDFSYMFKDFGHWFLVLWRLSSYFTAFHKLPEIPLIFKDFHRFRACMRAADPPPHPSLIFVQNLIWGTGFLIMSVCIFCFSLGASARSEAIRTGTTKTMDEDMPYKHVAMSILLIETLGTTERVHNSKTSRSIWMLLFCIMLLLLAHHIL